MLGFGKKKKENKETEAPDEASAQDSDQKVATAVPEEEAPAKPKKKKSFNLKKILLILAVLVAVGASAFVVYYFYFSKKGADEGKPVYKKVSLENVSLPEEILRFSFDYLPEVYSAFLKFNAEVNLISAEIERIEAIAQQYPEQKKIADKEKKVWEKTRSKLEKGFSKIEKPVRETYVLFRVNKTQGLEQITAKYPGLSSMADDALKQSDEVTKRIKTKETVPEGFFKGNIYKLKKKFL